MFFVFILRSFVYFASGEEKISGRGGNADNLCWCLNKETTSLSFSGFILWHVFKGASTGLPLGPGSRQAYPSAGQAGDQAGGSVH